MKKLNTFLNGSNNLDFGDYILFQEYKQDTHDGKQYYYKISKPILAIYLGAFIADQTAGFNYVIWNNENHRIYITNEYVTNYSTNKQVSDIKCHIEWSDYLDILGHWKHKPNWKEIIKSYREQNLKINISSDEINLNII